MVLSEPQCKLSKQFHLTVMSLYQYSKQIFVCSGKPTNINIYRGSLNGADKDFVPGLDVTLMCFSCRGLLSGHVLAEFLKSSKKSMRWYQGELLEMAKELGERLLPAFNTTTGIPFPKVNLRHGLEPSLARTGHEKDTCTACAGTMLLEFAALSRLTGDPIFEVRVIHFSRKSVCLKVSIMAFSYSGKSTSCYGRSVAISSPQE